MVGYLYSSLLYVCGDILGRVRGGVTWGFYPLLVPPKTWIPYYHHLAHLP